MERGIRVLHVDDDPDVPRLVKTYLEREDDRLCVESAGDAAAGLERLRDGEFDCVVSDYDMPGRDGIEFLEAVRERHPDLPFILFTGKGSEAVASDAISAGVTDYLQKGPNTEQFQLLANRVTNVVSQRRSERQLAAERERFQLLFERLTQPVVEVEYQDEQPIVLQVNSAFEATFGYTADEIVGESLDEFIVPEEFHEEAEAINDRGQEGGRLSSESVTRRTADGRREFLLQNAAYADGSGGFAIYTDVTEREERERRLRRSLDLLEHTERLASTGGWEVDLRTGDVHWTDGAYTAHGLDPSDDVEPTLSSVMELYDPADRALIGRTLTELPRDDEPLVEELRLDTPAAEDSRWVRVGGESVTDEGEVVAVRGAVADITDRKRRERKLERRNDLFEQAERIADIGAWETDLEADEGWWTDQVARIYGLPTSYDPDPGEGIEYFHPEDREEIRAAFDRACETGEPYDLELRVEAADDERRWVRVQCDPALEDGDVVRVRGTLQDITDRKRRERELRRQNERLDEFASVVSHDLRTPLSVARGRLELLEERIGPDEDLEAVTDAHDRMATLIEDLLGLARSGEPVEARSWVDLASVVEECERALERADATVSVAGDHAVKADESRLRQLLENLIRNAVEHAPGEPSRPDGEPTGEPEASGAGSTPGVTSSDGGSPAVDDRWGDAGTSVTIEVGPLADEPGFYVADDGVGVRPADRERVFESGYSTAADGTGFGLAIARDIADVHGWDLAMTESRWGGARVEVRNVTTRR